jgi:hypothetical protein
VPAVSFEVGLQVLDGEAQLSTGPILGPPLPDEPLILDPLLNGPATVTDRASGGEQMVVPFVGLELELMAPILVEGAGAPRPFLAIGISGALGTNSDVAKTGVPGPFGLPADLPDGPLVERVVLGQGARVSAEVQPLGVEGTLGLAFVTGWGDRQLRLRPAVTYRRSEVEISGVAQRAVQQRSIPPPTQLDDFRLIALSDDFTEVYHSVGPKLEIEMDGPRLGPWTLAVYLQGSATAILGDRKTELQATNGFGEQARWRFEVDPWSFQVATGVRLRWTPE